MVFVLLLQIVLLHKLFQIVVHFHLTGLCQLANLSVKEVLGDDEVPGGTGSMEVVNSLESQVIGCTRDYVLH